MIVAYRDGYIVQNIDCTPGSEYIEFNQGRFLELGQELGGLGEDIMKAQVYETVEQHLKKEHALGDMFNQGLKHHAGEEPAVETGIAQADRAVASAVIEIHGEI